MTIRMLAVALSLAGALVSPARAAPPAVPHTFSAGTPARAAEVNANFQALATAIGGAMPTGTILPYAGTSAPPGFLLCNGAAVSRATFAALFEVVGTSFGGGDGSTTFNVPDLRGMFVRGAVGLGSKDFLPADVNPATDTITVTGHGLNRSGFPVRFTAAGGALPGPLSATATYYAIHLDGNRLQVALTEAGALAATPVPVDLVTQGTGTLLTLVPAADPDAAARTASGPGGATGDLVGSKQEDALQDLEGTLSLSKAGEGIGSATGAFQNSTTAPQTVAGHSGTATFNSAPTIAFDASLVARTSTETRPRNVGVNWIVRY